MSPSSSGAQEVERLALLREALRHLARAGANCNQIAHAANVAALEGKRVGAVLGGAEAAVADLRAALAELRTWPGLRSAARVLTSVSPEQCGNPGPLVRWARNA